MTYHRHAGTTESDGRPQPATPVPPEGVFSSSPEASGSEEYAGIEKIETAINKGMRGASSAINKGMRGASSASSATVSQTLLEVREEMPDDKKRFRASSSIIANPQLDVSMIGCAKLEKTPFRRLTTREGIQNAISLGSSTSGSAWKTLSSTESVGGLLGSSSIDGSQLDSQVDSQFD
jgi:hypothetical protein